MRGRRRSAAAGWMAALWALLAGMAWAQAGASYAVQVTVERYDKPFMLVLNWPEPDPGRVRGYTIHRRTPGAEGWGEPIADGSSVFVYSDGRRGFADTTIEIGQAYEYAVARTFVVDAASGATHTAYGYVLAGFEVPLVERRGTLVLVVEQGLREPLAAELARLERDLVGDGWQVAHLEAARTESPADVKARIKAVYEADPAQVRALFLFGRVPVPYSGTFLPSPPDGHTAAGDDHSGAWPADVYYADMDGTWTDETESYVNRNNPRGTNVPGDGKFDPSYLPSDVELQLGRVDLSSLPGAANALPLPDETTLLRQYLDKDHAYRHARLPVRRRALIGDSRDPSGGRAYPASGYRSFAPMFGPAHLTIASTEPWVARDERWLRLLTADSYQWVYGFGAGSNTGASGLGFRGAYFELWSADLVDERAQGVFYLLFGSWFGDWDQSDNLLRSALLTPHGLASAWSGRPHLVFHGMALGETLGACIRASQNNADTYRNQINTFRRGVHIALMGDPTLRLHPVAPPREVEASRHDGSVVLTWRAAAADVLGYHVYRAAPGTQAFTRLTETPIPQLYYVDPAAADAHATYMVRAIALEQTPAGSYYNASQGSFAEVSR